MTSEDAASGAAHATVCSPAPGRLEIRLAGVWLLARPRPTAETTLARLDAEPDTRHIGFDCSRLGDWDTGLVTLLVAVERAARDRNIAVDRSGLPAGAQRLLELAFAVGEPTGSERHEEPQGMLASFGSYCLSLVDEVRRTVVFVGELTLSFGRLLRGKATYERSDLLLTLQEVSVEALGIVSIVGFLVGVILGFIGAVQFQKFGAGIFAANLIGLGIVRELGPIMAGIIMAGRTGAAFAAHIGTMKVNEEIDALRTLGIDPIDYLVLPRALALMLMMPLVTLYADLMGIAGGTVVGMGLLDVSLALFVDQLRSSLTVGDVLVGLLMAAVFGVLVAIAGCQRGIECGTSAQAVGTATTSAVVSGIVAIVAACSLFNLLYTLLGI